MKMDEMELDRYVTGILDTEHRNLKQDVKAKPNRNGGDNPDVKTTNPGMVETNR